MKKDIEIQENIQEIGKKIESFKKDLDSLESEIQKHKEIKIFTNDEKQIAEEKIENERLAIDMKKAEIESLIQTTEALNSLENSINKEDKKEVEDQLKTLKASLATIVTEYSWRGKTKLKATTLWQSLPTRGKRGLGLGGGILAWKARKSLSQSSWMPWNRFKKEDVVQNSEEDVKKEVKTEAEEVKETTGEPKKVEEKKDQETTTPKKEEEPSVADKVIVKAEEVVVEKAESLRNKLLKRVGL